MKHFKDEIIKFHNKLVSGENFAFSKYADGEWLAMCNIISTPGNNEWVIDETESTRYSRELLIRSFQYKDPGYYVGISCPCCQGHNHQLMKQFSGQDDEHLTFANLFVNANFPYFKEHFIKEFKNRKIILVANENTDLDKLPFKIEEFYPISYNGWTKNLDLLNKMQGYSYRHNTENLYLFSCGPLGNILVKNLWEENKTHTYLDIGSTIDFWVGNDVKNKRCYATGVTGYADKICVWGE